MNMSEDLDANTCRLCGKSFKYIAQHLKTKHKVYDLAAYYKKYIIPDQGAPTCKKCGKETRFKSIALGFFKSCSPSCDNPLQEKVWVNPAKRRKRSIISRKAAKKVLRKRWGHRKPALKLSQKTFPMFGSDRSHVPRVHSVTEFGEFLLRSKIERNFVCALLRSRQHIIKIEYEKTFIRYYSSSQSKHRHYIPDFKIFWTNGLVDIVEVKPEKDKIDPIVVDKKNEAIRYCATHGMSYFMISPKEYQRYIDARLSGNMYS